MVEGEPVPESTCILRSLRHRIRGNVQLEQISRLVVTRTVACVREIGMDVSICCGYTVTERPDGFILNSDRGGQTGALNHFSWTLLVLKSFSQTRLEVRQISAAFHVFPPQDKSALLLVCQPSLKSAIIHNDPV